MNTYLFLFGVYCVLSLCLCLIVLQSLDTKVITNKQSIKLIIIGGPLIIVLLIITFLITKLADLFNILYSMLINWIKK